MLLTTPPGERAKSWPVVQRLARELLERGAHRGSPPHRPGRRGGGGPHRLPGLHLYAGPALHPGAHHPAGHGGCGNRRQDGHQSPEGKNLLGTFHQPRLVASDPEFLQTLPRAEFLNGLAEVLKAGFIRDADLLDRLAAGPARLLRDQEALAAIIYRAAAIKAEVVAQDEREGGLRRILNFGHTLGHGLEQASAFKLPHGRAVAWGMLAALSLSEKLAGLPAAEARRGRQLIRDLGLTRRSLPPLDPQAVLAALSRDKKRLESGVVFVLLRRLGEAVVREDVSLAIVEEVLGALLRES